jgi:uncharacterized membrane protein YwaF
MRTLVLIVIGLIVVLVTMTQVATRHRGLAAGTASLVWLAVVLWNLMTGMSHGYTLQQELPIQLCILLPPVALAWWMARAK